MKQLLIAGLVLALAPLYAATEQKIGFIYSDQVITGYQGMTEANAALAKEKAAFKSKADSLNTELTKARSDFQAEELLLSEEGKSAKNAEINDLQRGYDSYLNDVYGPGGKLEQKTQELMAPVIQKIKDAVEQAAKADDYTLVFDASESKLAILYAASSANLTASVLDGLNRELAPVTTGAIVDRRYAVCPLFEASDEAQQANLGEQCRGLVYDLVKNLPHTQMVTNTELASGLLNKGISGRANVTEELAFDVGKTVQADYIFFGSVTMSGKKVTITLSVADPRLSNTFPPETDNTSRPDEYKQVLGNIVHKLVSKLPPMG
jgi:outer membrane protein